MIHSLKDSSIIASVMLLACMSCQPSAKNTADNQVDIDTLLDSTAGKRYAVFVSSGDSKDGVGVGVYEWKAENGALAAVSSDSTYESSAYLAVDTKNLKLYHVGDKLASFDIDKNTGELTLLNAVENTGEGACHISIANNQNFVTVAYYSSGSAATFALTQDGSLGAEVSRVEHKGASVNKERQESPHIHMAFATPNSDLILLPDLGIDQVKVYKASATGKLSPAPNPLVTIDAGGGPRHVARSPNGKYLYVLHELTGHVTAFEFDGENGIGSKISTVSTLPLDFRGFNKSADIHVHPNGKYLYASNRGHNSLAIFGVDKNTGDLTFLGAKDCGGDWPRAFAIDPSGNFILVANKNSNQISILKIDHSTGFFDKVGEVATVLAPQCISFLELGTR